MAGRPAAFASGRLRVRCIAACSVHCYLHTFGWQTKKVRMITRREEELTGPIRLGHNVLFEVSPGEGTFNSGCSSIHLNCFLERVFMI